jgi:AsmA protein
LALAAPGLGVAADGEASPAGDAVLALTADMAPRVLFDWLGQPVEPPAGALEAVTFTVDVAAAPTGVALRALTLAVDDLLIEGDLELALAGRPSLSGTLDLNDLDLRPYLAAGPAAEPQPVTVAAATPEAADGAEPQGWPDQPLDLPLPLPFDLAVNIRQSSLITPDVHLGIGAITLSSDAAATTLQIDELTLYDGSMTGRVELRPVGDAETLDVAVDLDAIGVQLQPLLTALAEIDRLAGLGNLRFAGSTRGASIAELMGNLDGEGAVLARDGAILGINIAATIRQVTSLGALSAAREPQRTDFAEAGGTFTIAGGVLDNDDFALRAPVLRVTGAGTVDLGARTIDYRLLPRLAATLEGQDAAREDAFQAGLPLVVSGPWDDPAIRLDLGTALSGDVSDPAALANVVRNIAADPQRREALQDMLGIDPESPLGTVFEGLGGLLGGPREPAPEDDEAGQPPPAAQDPAGQALDALRGLLRR